MTRSKRIRPVVNVAEKRELEQAKRLGECQRRLEQEQAQLQQLIQYRDDYARHFRESGKTGLSVTRLQDFRVFLQRLNKAIEQQTQAIAQAEQACESQRERWLASRTKAKALDKVADRYQREERREQERREQAESDERALQQHLRRDK